MANGIKCELVSCDKRFVKTVGHFIHGKWFCSEQCGDQDPDTLKIKQLYENGIEFNNENGDDDDYGDGGEIDL